MIRPIIVIYNKRCEDSPACEFALETGLKAIICDNSTEKNDNDLFCINHGFNYLPMDGNKGIAKAYNKALSEEKAEYYLFLDDDTKLPSDFLEKAKEHIKKSPADVFIPKVLSGNIIISPAVFGTARVKRWQGETENITAINSGLIAKAEVFSKFRYDENMFLDYIDHDFMKFINNTGKKIHIMDDVVLSQEFFGLTKQSREARKKRYKIFKKDFNYYTNKHKQNKFLAKLILLKRKMSAI